MKHPEALERLEARIVKLIEVDVVGAETLEASLERGSDECRREVLASLGGIYSCQSNSVSRPVILPHDHSISVRDAYDDNAA